MPEPCSRTDRIGDSVPCNVSNQSHIHRLSFSPVSLRFSVGSLPVEVVGNRFVGFDDTCWIFQNYFSFLVVL